MKTIKYAVKRECGHKEVVDLWGCEERQLELRWGWDTPCCKECQRAAEEKFGSLIDVIDNFKENNPAFSIIPDLEILKVCCWYFNKDDGEEKEVKLDDLSWEVLEEICKEYFDCREYAAKRCNQILELVIKEWYEALEELDSEMEKNENALKKWIEKKLKKFNDKQFNNCELYFSISPYVPDGGDCLWDNEIMGTFKCGQQYNEDSIMDKLMDYREPSESPWSWWQFTNWDWDDEDWLGCNMLYLPPNDIDFIIDREDISESLAWEDVENLEDISDILLVLSHEGKHRYLTALDFLNNRGSVGSYGVVCDFDIVLEDDKSSKGFEDLEDRCEKFHVDWEWETPFFKHDYD